MAKIISVNAGSSSLKFQLFEMDDESVITSGVIERIGLEDSIFTIKYDGKKTVTTSPIKDHKVAVELLLDTLIEKGIVKDLDEIKGVGHRVVQGGAYFDSSVIIDEEHRIRKENTLRRFEEYENLCFGKVNDKIKVVDSIKILNKKLHLN